MSRTRHSLKEARLTGAKAISKVCRHGECPACYGNKQHKHRKQTAMDEEAIQQELDLQQEDEAFFAEFDDEDEIFFYDDDEEYIP